MNRYKKVLTAKLIILFLALFLTGCSYKIVKVQDYNVNSNSNKPTSVGEDSNNFQTTTTDQVKDDLLVVPTTPSVPSIPSIDKKIVESPISTLPPKSFIESWESLESRLLAEALNKGQDTAIIKNDLGETKYYYYFYRTGWNQTETKEKMNELAVASRSITEYEKGLENSKKIQDELNATLSAYRLSHPSSNVQEISRPLVAPVSVAPASDLNYKLQQEQKYQECLIEYTNKSIGLLPGDTFYPMYGGDPKLKCDYLKPIF